MKEEQQVQKPRKRHLKRIPKKLETKQKVKTAPDYPIAWEGIMGFSENGQF